MNVERPNPEPKKFFFQGREMIKRLGPDGEKIPSKLHWIGENPACDPIVTREIDGHTEVLLITRKDGKLAPPGGFIEENVFQEEDGGELTTANKELEEETRLVDKQGNPIRFTSDDKFHDGRLATKDPRNDETSEITTSIFHRHFEGSDAETLKFRDLTEEEKGKSEYNEEQEGHPAKWYRLSQIDLNDMYPHHADMIFTVLKEKDLIK